MDIVRYVFSDHAIKRFKKRFPRLILEEETETLTPCKAKDYSFMSGTLSYKRIKKTERHKYRFLVSDNGAYFICKTIDVVEGVESLKVITVLRNDQDDGFESMMYEHALRLIANEREIEASLINKPIEDAAKAEAERKEQEKADNQKRREQEYEKASNYLFESEHFGFLLEYKESLLDANVNRYCSILHTASTLYRSYSDLKERVILIDAENGVDPDFSRKKELASIAAKIEKAFIVRELPVHAELTGRWKESVEEIINEYIDMEATILRYFYDDKAKITSHNRDSILLLFGVIIRNEDIGFIQLAKLTGIANYLINYETCIMSEIYSGSNFSGNSLLDKIAHLNYLAKLPFITDDMREKLHRISSFYDVVLDRMIDLGIDDKEKITMLSLNPSSKVDEEAVDTEVVEQAIEDISEEENASVV